MARLRSNNVFGTTTDNPLTNVATSFNSAGLANLVAVTGSDTAVIILDPNRVNGAPEIVYVTAHTGSATVATISRGQEGTAARQHPSGTFWVHGATAAELGIGTAGYAQVTANQGGITTEVDLTSLTVTFTTVTGRRYKIAGSVACQSTVVGDAILLRIYEDDTLIRDGQVHSAVANQDDYIERSVIRTPSAGSHTYKLRMLRAAGTGTITMSANVNSPAHILIEDIGAA